VPEIIEDGFTGAVVDTMEEAIAALPRVMALDRNKVRQRFEQRFYAMRMAGDYVGVYRSLVASKSLGSKERSAQRRLWYGNGANDTISQIAWPARLDRKLDWAAVVFLPPS